MMQATFFEDFKTLDNWIVSTWTAPQAHSLNHAGTFSADNVRVYLNAAPGQAGDSGVCLKLSQALVNGQIVSTGAEITSKQSFGYGVYDFVVRAGSTAPISIAQGGPISGGITGCFNYLEGSATEIDVEIEGGVRSALTQFTSWIGESLPNQTLQVTNATGTDTPEARFFAYRFIWTPGKIEFYRDGVRVATFTEVVPSKPAPFMFNHWGTNDRNWGGFASVGSDRFMYIKSFAYTAYP